MFIIINIMISKTQIITRIYLSKNIIRKRRPKDARDSSVRVVYYIIIVILV